MSTDIAVLILFGVGIVMLGVLVAFAARQRGPSSAAEARAARGTSLGMSVGMLCGAALGTLVWISTGEFVFWVIFLGAGMTVGMAMGRGLATR